MMTVKATLEKQKKELQLAASNVRDQIFQMTQHVEKLTVSAHQIDGQIKAYDDMLNNPAVCGEEKDKEKKKKSDKNKDKKKKIESDKEKK